MPDGFILVSCAWVLFYVVQHKKAELLLGHRQTGTRLLQITGTNGAPHTSIVRNSGFDYKLARSLAHGVTRHASVRFSDREVP